MIPRLQAEEACAAAEQIAVGTGSLPAGASSEVRRRWVRTAEGDRRRSAGPVAPATPERLQSHGIGVRRVVRKAAPTP